MPVRTLPLVVVVLVSLAAAPAAPPPTAPPEPTFAPSTAGGLPTDDAFAELVKRDVVAALEMSLRRYRQDVHGYRCVFDKHERLGGTVQPPERIRAAFREEPFAVLFKWEKGAGQASATLYAKGENGGQLLALSTLLGGVIPSSPTGFLAERSSRYTIKDFGLYYGCLRTFLKWRAARAAGTLRVEYLGTRPVPECGGRVCHVVRRTCDPPDIDNFSLEQATPRDAARFPKEQIHAVTIMLDAATWQQVGSDVRHPDGGVLGSYYFRDIEPNPAFAADQFAPAAVRK